MQGQRCVEVRLQARSNRSHANAHVQFGDTPLHEAARAGRLRATQFLVEKGADVHALNKVSVTAATQLATNRSDLECPPTHTHTHPRAGKAFPAAHYVTQYAVSFQGRPL